jgi:hypothetical protein
MAAATLVDRIRKDVIGLSDGSQHVGKMGCQLGVIPQDLVAPYRCRHDHSHALGIFRLSSWFACHRTGSVSDVVFCHASRRPVIAGP